MADERAGSDAGRRQAVSGGRGMSQMLSRV
jgi:hypothetical protein